MKIPFTKPFLLLAALLLSFSIITHAQNWNLALSSSDTFSYARENCSKCEATDAAGNVFILANGAGVNVTFGSKSIQNPASANTMVVKFDSSGNYIWSCSIYCKSNFLENKVTGMSIATDASGNVLVTGYCNSDTLIFDSLILVKGVFSVSEGNSFLAKYDASGHVLWARTVNEGSAAIDPISVTTDNSGNIYLAGVGSGLTVPADTLISDSVRLIFGIASHDLFLLKYDSSGHTIWGRKSDGSPCNFCSSTTDPAGNTWLLGQMIDYVISFDTLTLAGSQFSTVIVKYNSSGHAVWGTTNYDLGSFYAPWDIAVDHNDNIYVTDQYFLGDSATFGTIVIKDTVTNYRGEILLVKYDSSGSARWVKNRMDTNTNFFKRIALDNSGNVYVTGTDSTSRIYLAKYDTAGNNQWIASANAGSASFPQTIATDPWANVYVLGEFNCPEIEFGSISLTNTGPGASTPNLFLARESGYKPTEVINKRPAGQDILMYPNPATDEVTLSFPGNNHQIGGEISISNLLGQVVKTCSYNAAQVQINLASLQSGIYLVRINGIEVRKLVKE